MRFFIADGKIVNSQTAPFIEDHLYPNMRLYQKVWFGYGGIPLFTENLKLLEDQAAIAGIPFPDELKNNRELFRLTKRMLNKNKFYRSGYIFIQIIPGADTVHTLVTCSAFAEFIFPLADEGVLMNFSDIEKKVSNASRFNYFNTAIWNTALAAVKKTHFNQTILLNENKSICESPYSNIFMIKINELITPSYLSGCHENALRKILFKAATEIGLKVSEKPQITKEMLLKADELFIASEATGMQWIQGINEQRYVHYYSKIIIEQINNLLKEKAVENAW